MRKEGRKGGEREREGKSEERREGKGGQKWRKGGEGGRTVVEIKRDSSVYTCTCNSIGLCLHTNLGSGTGRPS